jgi:hypothetical protein
MYAVEVADLTNYRFVGQFVLALIVGSRQIVDAEPGRLDGGAVLLDYDEEQAVALMQIIRTRLKKHELHIYHGNSGKGWRRV